MQSMLKRKTWQEIVSPRHAKQKSKPKNEPARSEGGLSKAEEERMWELMDCVPLQDVLGDVDALVDVVQRS